MTLQATYGRPAGTPEDPGGFGGANKARDEWWKRRDDNDAQQGLVNNGMNYADSHAALGQSRGATAFEDQGLSDNEASGAGGHQQGAIGLAGTLARGQVPSQAAMQLQAGLNQGMSQQQSMAASARGGAALAVARPNADANIAAMQQSAFTQGGLLRSRDMAAGRGMLGTGLGQMQEQDQRRLGMANQLGQYNAEANDRFSLGMGAAANNLGGTAIGQDKNDLLWYQGGMTSVDAQSEADQQRKRWEADAEAQRIAARKEDE
jgi:hypothetical protein